jgi:hypothetical protein
MTELLTRPGSAPAYDDHGGWAGRSTWFRGLLGASWAVAVGVACLVVVVLVTWAADSRAASGAAGAMRAALQIWLAGHHVPLRVGDATVAVAPLLLTLCLAALVARAAAAVARLDDVTDGYGVVRVAFAVGLPYAALTTFVAAAATAAPVRPSPVAALGSGLLLGVLSAAWGAARGAGLVGVLWSGLPDRVRLPAAAGLAAVGVLLAGSRAPWRASGWCPG